MNDEGGHLQRGGRRIMQGRSGSRPGVQRGRGRILRSENRVYIRDRNEDMMNNQGHEGTVLETNVPSTRMGSPFVNDMNNKFTRSIAQKQTRSLPYGRTRSFGTTEKRNLLSSQSYRIEITNIGDAKSEEVIQFLLGHASRPFRYSNVHREEGKLSMSVNGMQQAKVVTKLSGIRFNAKKLSIHMKPELNETPMAIIITLEEQENVVRQYLCTRRYNDESKAMDLSGLVNDQELRTAGVSVDFSNPLFVSMLFKVIKDMYPLVATLNLASNRIKTSESLRPIVIQFPDLLNLNLERNFIYSLEEIDALKGLHKLRELILVNNPLRNRLRSEEEIAHYAREIAKKIPSLKLLDQKEVQPIIHFDLPTHVVDNTLPLPRENFFDAESTKNLTESFLKKFFELYDKARPSLSDIYAINAYFTLSLNNLTPAGYRTTKENFQEYITISRNLLRVKDPKKRQSLVFSGNSSIIPSLNSLPRTFHLPENFKVDACQQADPILLFISVHGYFIQLPEKLVRAFDRTFILIPATPTSLAALNGWPVVIANDQLHIRTSSFPMEPSPSHPIQSLPRERQLVELSTQTGMNLLYAEQCLRQNLWSYSAAIENYHDLKSKNLIPAEAYLPM